MNSWQRIFAVIHKEVIQLRRDRLTFGMIIGIPTALLLLFGYAINMDPRNLDAGYADLADTSASRQFVADLAQSQVVNFRYRAASAEQLEDLLRSGKITVGLLIPGDYDRRLQDPHRAAAQLLIDGSDTVVQGAAARLRQAASVAPYGYQPPQLELRTYYNPERRSPVNTVPGLIGVILTMTMVLFTSVAIVRERERGNLELLIATPIRTPELMLAKIVPYVLIGLVQVSLILLLGHVLFQVPIRGRLVDVYLLALIFIIANLAVGLAISTIARSQFQAMQLTYFLLLPSILLSGFMFPFSGMPQFAQWIAEVLPMTHFMRLIRGIVLRGAGLEEMAVELGILAGFIVAAMTFAVVRFTKRLD